MNRWGTVMLLKPDTGHDWCTVRLSRSGAKHLMTDASEQFNVLLESCDALCLDIKLMIFTLFMSRSSNWTKGLHSIRHDDRMFTTGWARPSRPFIIIIIIMSSSSPVWDLNFRALHLTSSHLWTWRQQDSSAKNHSSSASFSCFPYKYLNIPNSRHIHYRSKINFGLKLCFRLEQEQISANMIRKIYVI